MRLKIAFEIVDKRHDVVENLAALGARHKQSLRAEHLGHLGHDRAAAVRDQPVGESADKRISGDARIAVRAAAFQSDAQLRGRTGYANIVGHDGFQLVGQLKTGGYLVAAVLTD